MTEDNIVKSGKELIYLFTNEEVDRIIRKKGKDILYDEDFNKIPLFSPDGRILNKSYIERENIDNNHK